MKKGHQRKNNGHLRVDYACEWYCFVFFVLFLSSYHIDNSVLWYFAQTLMYAGSCFGIGAYIAKFKNEVDEKINENKKP